MSEHQAGPTPSPQTNELYALCQAVSQGAQDRAAELQQKATARQAETGQAKATFLQAISTQSQEYMTEFADEIGNICNQFDGYAAALEEIAASLQQPEQLAKAAQALAEASIALRLAMMHYDNQVLASGPSRFKPVNLLENLGKAYLDGRTPAETWQGACQEWAAFHTKVIEEIDASPKKDAPGVPARREASTKAVRALEQLQKVTSAAELEAGVALWREAHQDLESALREYDENVFFSGPTPSPQANLVIQIARGVLDKRFRLSTLQEASEKMHELVRQGLLDFHGLSRQPTDVPQLLEELPRMLAALEGLDDSLQDIMACAQTDPPDANELNSALAEFEKAAVQLHSATQNIENYNQSSGKIPCPSCQNYNPPGSRFCSSCQRSLPQVAGGEGFGAAPGTLQVLESEGEPSAVGGPLITEKMKILNDACIALEQGEMADEAFLELLDSMEVECQQTEAGLAELRAPEIPEEANDEEAAKAQEFIDLAEDALALLSIGVSEIMAGLEQFRAFVHNRKPEDSVEGARLYFEGIQKLYQVQKVDEAFQRALASAPPPTPESDADEDEEEEEESDSAGDGEEAHTEDTTVA